jgi:hypothetical protein
MQKFIEGRRFVPAVTVLYLGMAGLLFFVTGTRSKGEIELFLMQWVPRFLWMNFLLIAIGVVLCRGDIAAALRELFTAPPPPDPLLQGKREEGVNAPQRRKSSQWRLNRPGVYLLTILIAGILLVTFAAPQVHRIYYDEDIYANMGQNIAYTGRTGMANWGSFEYGEYQVNWLNYNKDPSGWPFLIGIVFQLFGTNEIYAFILNNLLFVGGILVVFFITRVAAGGWFAGLSAALIYALIPHNLIWSNTVAAETPAAFFGGLSVLCTLVWLRNREARHLFLTVTVLPFACAMRPESAMILPWALATTATNWFPDGEGPGVGNIRRHPFATRDFWAAGLVFSALLIPHLWHFFAMSGQSWGAEGAKFSAGFFLHNLAINGSYYLDNRAFPLLFTLLALIGIVSGMGRNRAAGGSGIKRYSAAALILFWFVLFWGIFLFFYAGSYKYGADVRFALLSFMPIAVLAGIGAGGLRDRGGEWLDLPGWVTASPPPDRFRDGGEHTAQVADSGTAGPRTADRRLPVAVLLILILVFSWLKFLPLIRLVGQEAWGARYDHAYAREFIKKIPNRSIVLTHIPTMFLLWGQNAIQAYAGINNPEIIRNLMIRYNGQVYFHQSYWCNTLNDQNRQVCEGIRQRYTLEPVAVAHEQANEYGLYRMVTK